MVRFKPLRHHTAVRHCVDGYFSSTKDEHVVELYEHLQGPQRAVVFVHEVTHAIHSAARLRIRDTRARFVAAQVAGWLRFIRHNPGAWMWLLATIREQAEFGSRRNQRTRNLGNGETDRSDCGTSSPREAASLPAAGGASPSWVRPQAPVARAPRGAGRGHCFRG